MSLVDSLLKADIAKVTELPADEVEIKRLSKITGSRFAVKVRAINGNRYTEIQKSVLNIGSKGKSDFDIAKAKTLTVLEGIVEPDMRDKELLKQFKAVTPKEAINKIFLPGEIDRIYKKITELCGYDDEDDGNEDDIEEIKN